jgi:hypothetical protein
LAGHPPFWKPGGPNDSMSMSVRIVNDLLPPIPRDEVPPSLHRVLEVAMSKKPSQRYPTALEFARALQQAQIELHLPVTGAEVRVELAKMDVDDEPEIGETVAAEFVTSEATPTGAATELDDRSGSGFTGGTVHINTTDPGRDGPAPPVILPGGAEAAGPIELTATVAASLANDGDTMLAAQPPETHTSASEVVPPLPKRARTAVLALLAVVVLVLAIGAIVMLPKGSGDAGTQGAGTSTLSVSPVPQVAILTAVNNAGRVTVTWRNPSPLPGDQYHYEITDGVGTSILFDITSETQVTVKALPGVTCGSIILIRSDMRRSAPVNFCVDPVSPVSATPTR